MFVVDNSFIYIYITVRRKCLYKKIKYDAENLIYNQDAIFQSKRNH